jgi:hypothetical protein
MSPAATFFFWILGFIVFVLVWYLIIRTAVAHGIAKVIHFLAGHSESATATQLRIDFALLLNRLESGQAAALDPMDESDPPDEPDQLDEPDALDAATEPDA